MMARDFFVQWGGGALPGTEKRERYRPFFIAALQDKAKPAAEIVSQNRDGMKKSHPWGAEKHETCVQFQEHT